MRKQPFYLFLVILFLAFSGAKLLAQPVTPPSIAFVHVNVIPMHQEGVLRDQTVVIEGGRIVEIKPSEKINLRSDIRQIDAVGKYLLPGFADMHIHDFGGKLEDDFLLYLANGVTLVRNMSGSKSGVQIRERIDAGTLMAPHYFTSGPMIQAAQFDMPELDKLSKGDQEIAQGFIDIVKDRILTLKSDEDVASIIEEHKNLKYDFIKIHDDFPKHLYLKLLEAAKRAGIPVIGHAQRKLPSTYSTQLKSISHIEEFLHLFSDEELLDAENYTRLGKRVSKSGITIAPTLLTFDMIHRYSQDQKFRSLLNDEKLKYIPPHYRKFWASELQPYRSRKRFGTPQGQQKILEQLKVLKGLTLAMNNAGVPLILGTDVYGFVIPGFSVHEELELLVSAGLTPYQALRTATTNVADYLGKEKYNGGSIEKGKSADLVLLEKNPLEDIRNTRAINGVVTKGEWLDRKKLDQFLLTVAQKYEK